MKEITINKENTLVISTLKKMGYKTTIPRHRNANGSDLFAIKKDYVLSVEIKKTDRNRKGENGVLRVKPVQSKRTNDDLIAIILPCGYVLVEPMRDHIKCCNNQGYRYLNY